MISLNEIKSVIIRKSIHFLIALVPALASISYQLSVFLLCLGIIFYAFVEAYRFEKRTLPRWLPGLFIAKITVYASHRRDKQRFVLGPLTLGSGALCALLFFPQEAAAAAIYALAFGDGLAGLAGRIFGTIRPAFLFHKSIEGSIACFAAILFSAWFVVQNWGIALLCAVFGTIIEALPLEDFDNILIPAMVGTVVGFAS